jgi:hypothetical protein
MAGAQSRRASLKLVRGKEWVTIGGIIGNGAGRGGRTQSGKSCCVESCQIVGSEEQSRRRGGSRDSEMVTVDGLGWGGWGNRSKDSLGKGKQKFKQKVGKGDTGIKGRGVDRRPESKIGDASRARKDVRRKNVGSDCSVQMVAKAKAKEIVHIEKSGADRGANSSGFQSGIVRATRDMAEGGD